MAAAAVQPNMPAERSKVWTCRIDAPTDEQRKILYERSYASELIQRLAVLPVPPRDGAASAVDCFVVLSQRKSASPQLCELLLRGDWQQARFDSQEWERLRRACEDAGGVVHDKTHQGAREPAPLQPLPEQQQQPKPRGIAPSVSGVQCMWDGVVGCWRAADGGVHVAPRRESKEAAAAEERAAQDALPEWKRLLQGIHAWRLRSAFSELTTATAHEEMKRQVAQRMRELEKLQTPLEKLQDLVEIRMVTRGRIDHFELACGYIMLAQMYLDTEQFADAGRFCDLALGVQYQIERSDLPKSDQVRHHHIQKDLRRDQSQHFGELARLLMQLWRVKEAGEVCELAIVAYDLYDSWRPSPRGAAFWGAPPSELPWLQISRTRWMPHTLYSRLARADLEEMQQKIASSNTNFSYLIELQRELQQELRLLDPVRSWRHPDRRPHGKW